MYWVFLQKNIGTNFQIYEICETVHHKFFFITFINHTLEPSRPDKFNYRYPHHQQSFSSIGALSPHLPG